MLLRRGIISSGLDGGGGGYTDPNSIANLQLWMSGDGGLTTDLSDNAYTITNGSVTIDGTQLNGHDVFRYNGSTSQNTGAQIGRYADYTIGVVFKVDDATTRPGICGSGNSSGTSTSLYQSIAMPTDDNDIISYMSEGGSLPGYSFTSSDLIIDATWHKVWVRFTDGSAPIEIFIDGVLQSTTDSGTADNNTGSPQTFSLGRLGTWPSNQLVGNIAELTMYDSALTDAQIALNDSYFDTRYAL